MASSATRSASTKPPRQIAFSTTWSDEYVLAFLALLQAAPPDRCQFGVRLVELARPVQQQCVLNGGPEYQGREGLTGPPARGRVQASASSRPCRQKAQGDPHPEREAEQVWRAEGSRLGDGLFDRLARSLGLIGVDQRVRQGDQHLHAQRTVVPTSLSARSSRWTPRRSRLCRHARPPSREKASARRSPGASCSMASSSTAAARSWLPASKWWGADTSRRSAVSPPRPIARSISSAAAAGAPRSAPTPQPCRAPEG